jgi:hypothetical protein
MMQTYRAAHPHAGSVQKPAFLRYLLLRSIRQWLAPPKTCGYWPRCVRAARSGALEISISPPNGVYISKIKKIAPETDNAASGEVHSIFVPQMRLGS